MVGRRLYTAQAWVRFPVPPGLLQKKENTMKTTHLFECVESGVVFFDEGELHTY